MRTWHVVGCPPCGVNVDRLVHPAGWPQRRLARVLSYRPPCNKHWPCCILATQVRIQRLWRAVLARWDLEVQGGGADLQSSVRDKNGSSMTWAAEARLQRTTVEECFHQRLEQHNKANRACDEATASREARVTPRGTIPRAQALPESLQPLPHFVSLCSTLAGPPAGNGSVSCT